MSVNNKTEDSVWWFGHNEKMDNDSKESILEWIWRPEEEIEELA